jgi:hypothetical protein
MRIALCILISLCFLADLRATGDSLPSPAHPRQGYVDMMLEYMEARYRDLDLQQDLLYVSVHRQLLFHVKDGVLVAEYPIATASNGLGTLRDTYRTPTGLHRISEKIGEEVPPFGILKDRQFTGALADPEFAGSDRDWITSRILWLEGLEPGHNQGGDHDSHDRFIYIHGTANERSIGMPSSRGCIRMRNADVIDLFERVPVGTVVLVADDRQLP